MNQEALCQRIQIIVDIRINDISKSGALQRLNARDCLVYRPAGPVSKARIFEFLFKMRRQRHRRGRLGNTVHDARNL